MKKISLFLSALFLMCVISCKDACDDVNCMNGGTCLEGTCLCLDGYEGTECDAEIRAKYYGTWSGTLSGCSIDIPIIGEYPIPDLPVTLEFTESSVDVLSMDVSVGMSNTTASIDGSDITLEEVSLLIEAEMLDITLAGEGTFASDTQIDMDVTIGAQGFATTCPMVLTKE